MTRKTKAALSLICNCLLFVVTTGVVISDFFVPSPLIRNGWENFNFFTTDSNVLAAITAVPMSVCQIQILRGKRNSPARAFTFIKLASVASLLLTFFTVMGLLVPAYGIALELGGTNFHMHVGEPLLSFLSFVWLDGHERIPLSKAWIGVLPTAAYGAWYFIEVIVLQIWRDFYLFNSGGMWYVSALILLGISYGFSTLTIWIHTIIGKRARR